MSASPTSAARGRPASLLVTVTLALLGLAPSALAAETINLTRFSKTVSGTAPAGVTGVTVSLLRDTLDPATGGLVRNAVASFAATPDGSQNWSGSFATHAFSTSFDQVEVAYSNGTVRTIGGGALIRATGCPAANPSIICLAADSLERELSISSDGANIACRFSLCTTAGDGWVASELVGGATQQTNGGVPSTAGQLPLPTAATNATPVTVTVTDTVAGGPVVTLTDNAPLIAPSLPDVVASTPTFFYDQPFCAAYLVTSEIVCENLVPGAYTLTGPGVSDTLTVPGAGLGGGVLFLSPDYALDRWPSLAGAAVPPLADGQVYQLYLGSRLLTTLTVSEPTIQAVQPIGDPLNGGPGTSTGKCDPGLFLFGDGNSPPGLCATGTMPPNDLRNRGESVGATSFPVLLSGTGIGYGFGQFDDSGPGRSLIQMPAIVFGSPTPYENISTPFVVSAMPRYNDPLTVVAHDQGVRPPQGRVPTIASTPSRVPVVFSYAPLGSSNFVTLGNVNVPGGLTLPALEPGTYQGEFTVGDGRGDFYTTDDLFYVDSYSSPPPTPFCSARVRGHLKPQALLARKHGNRRAPARTGVTLTCVSPLSGELVSVWLERAGATVAQGTGSVTHGRAKIALTGRFVRGVYQLVVVAESGGDSGQSSQFITLR